MRVPEIALALGVLAMAAGCGGGNGNGDETAPASADSREIGKQLEDVGQSIQRAFEQDTPASAGEAVQALGEALGGAEPVAPTALQDLLPAELGGMQRVSSSAEEAGGLGVKVAKAQAEYAAGPARIIVLITDLGSASGMAAMGLDMFDAQISQEDDTGFERTAEYKGHRSFEKYQEHAGSSFAEMMVFVGDRFMVQVDGQDVTWEQIESAMSGIDLAALASMRTAQAGG